MEDVASFSWVLFHTFILVFHFFQPCKRGNTYFWLFQMNKLHLRRGWQGNLEPQSQKAAKHSFECRSDPRSPRSFPGVTEGEVGGWSTTRLSFQKRWDLTSKWERVELGQCLHPRALPAHLSVALKFLYVTEVGQLPNLGAS